MQLDPQNSQRHDGSSCGLSSQRSARRVSPLVLLSPCHSESTVPTPSSEVKRLLVSPLLHFFPPAPPTLPVHKEEEGQPTQKQKKKTSTPLPSSCFLFLDTGTPVTPPFLPCYLVSISSPFPSLCNSSRSFPIFVDLRGALKSFCPAASTAHPHVDQCRLLQPTCEPTYDIIECVAAPHRARESSVLKERAN